MRKHILIVDDEELFREICLEMLSERGYRVSVAEDVPAAMNVFGADRVDLLVADITLPGMDGLSMVEQLQVDHPDLPTIIITGFLTQDNMLRSLNLGVRGFLTKPFFYDELFQAVEKALDGSAASRNQTLLDHYLPLIRLGEEILAVGPGARRSTILDLALNIALTHSGATQGMIALPALDPTQLEVIATCGFSPEEQPRLAGYLARAVNTLAEHGGVTEQSPDALVGEVMPGFEVLVVRMPGPDPNGLMLLGRPNDVVPFFQEERKLAHLLAVQAAIALQQRHNGSADDRGETYADLVNAVVSDSFGLTRDARDRLAQLSFDLAHTMGCSRVQCQAVKQAALFHDFGKAYVPLELLERLGPLAESELHSVRAYVLEGALRLGRMRGLSDAAVLVANHRERWDGQGYPNGVQGEVIPLGAQIVGLLSCWQAMQTPRPHRPALTEHQATQAVVAASGSAFKPELVSALVATLGRDTLQTRRAGKS